MINLAATFENSNGRNHRWSMKDPDTSKSATEIKTSLEKLTALNLFEKDGVGLFQKVVTAKFVETIVTPIFDKNDPTNDEATAMTRAESVKTQTVPTVEPIIESTENSAEPIRDLRELIVEQKMIQPDILRQVVELPECVNAEEPSQHEAVSLVLAIIPPNGTLEDLSMDQSTEPVRMILTVRMKEKPKSTAGESPPKKRRKRLLEWLRG
ncbi:DUF2922 domain-containing protein [Enterococcus malodoratus]|uniref:DUF2922 family protein n=1 Tax=Enterococcus malodoratus ATCC 43197 TaxID=1158601 RepID=R2NSQ1_9ENTE|nr:DUF2922 domain-containing protein [Enterococcus malodoratus]EOH75077.1 hypothetical protein UAI_03318 [Enterococcus malodoratus ATCC 43197]EOT66979.1 hypothetical protein I585_02500 [Enterococcus malodoratus ATCC 43197]OJG63638.1 hypothetical protein RV07_GL000945 [Enterococcus malodoratus]SPX03899.1 Protein of uncharacterised function (DUF2922) [Enterococcus malodoratus]STD69769.1 Protein of uncharacterised function (DUF2922) [Enterococcus malodoratus]